MHIDDLLDRAERMYIDVKRTLASCLARTGEQHQEAHLKELSAEALKTIEEIRLCFNKEDKDLLQTYRYCALRRDQLERIQEHANELVKKLTEEEKARLLEVEKAAFSHKDQEFSEAQGQHEAWAIFCAVMVFACLFLIAWLIYWNIKGLSLDSTGPISNNILIFVGLGKVSLVAFCVWGIRYLMIIHMAHSAQAITYRDRRMALAVAEATFKLSESATEKGKVLSRVVDSCFDLSKNSFYNIKDPNILPNSKQIVALSDALKPVIELAKTATSTDTKADKSKDEEKEKN